MPKKPPKKPKDDKSKQRKDKKGKKGKKDKSKMSDDGTDDKRPDPKPIHLARDDEGSHGFVAGPGGESFDLYHHTIYFLGKPLVKNIRGNFDIQITPYVGFPEVPIRKPWACGKPPHFDKKGKDTTKFHIPIFIKPAMRYNIIVWTKDKKKKVHHFRLMKKGFLLSKRIELQEMKREPQRKSGGKLYRCLVDALTCDWKEDEMVTVPHVQFVLRMTPSFPWWPAFKIVNKEQHESEVEEEKKAFHRKNNKGWCCCCCGGGKNHEEEKKKREEEKKKKEVEHADQFEKEHEEHKHGCCDLLCFCFPCIRKKFSKGPKKVSHGAYLQADNLTWKNFHVYFDGEQFGDIQTSGLWKNFLWIPRHYEVKVFEGMDIVMMVALSLATMKFKQYTIKYFGKHIFKHKMAAPTAGASHLLPAL
ncbi:MAG: hypothetical protein Q9162_007362 [Coniocarpon cinnabarinum]